jgi:PAS domain-containing protein
MGHSFVKSRCSEAQLAEQERQFREILEDCPAALVAVDEDERLLFHNARLLELLGYHKEELELFDPRGSGTTSSSGHE